MDEENEGKSNIELETDIVDVKKEIATLKAAKKKKPPKNNSFEEANNS